MMIYFHCFMDPPEIGNFLCIRVVTSVKLVWLEGCTRFVVHYDGSWLTCLMLPVIDIKGKLLRGCGRLFERPQLLIIW